MTSEKKNPCKSVLFTFLNFSQSPKVLHSHCQDDADCEEGKMVVAGHGKTETSLILNIY